MGGGWSAKSADLAKQEKIQAGQRRKEKKEGKTSFKEQLKKEKEMEKMVLEERRSSRLPTTAEIAQLTVKEKVKEANKKWNAEYAFLNKGRRRMSLPTAEARAEDIRQALGMSPKMKVMKRIKKSAKKKQKRKNSFDATSLKVASEGKKDNKTMVESIRKTEVKSHGGVGRRPSLHGLPGPLPNFKPMPFKQRETNTPSSTGADADTKAGAGKRSSKGRRARRASLPTSAALINFQLNSEVLRPRNLLSPPIGGDKSRRLKVKTVPKNSSSKHTFNSGVGDDVNFDSMASDDLGMGGGFPTRTPIENLNKNGDLRISNVE